jgi:hypothetical protein
MNAPVRTFRLENAVTGNYAIITLVSIRIETGAPPLADVLIVRKRHLTLS